MAKRFAEIIERYPRNEYALRAVRLSLNSLYMKATLTENEAERNKHWADVNHWAKTFMANKVLMGSPAARQEKFAEEIQSLVEESGYNVVLALRQKSPLEAAKGFDQFVADYPKSKFAHRALYAAMVIYDEADQLDLAIRAGKHLLQDYKDSDRTNSTIGYLAVFHDRIADFVQAAMYHELYFNKWLEQEGKDQDTAKGVKAKKSGRRAASKPKPKPKKPKSASTAEKGDAERPALIAEKAAMDALYNAALLRESLGQYSQAVANYVKYIKHFPDAKDVPDLFYKIGMIYERQAQWRKADRVWEAYPKKYADRSTPGRLLAVLYKHTMAIRKLSKGKDISKELDLIVEKYNKLDEKVRNEEARLAVAHARFLQVEKEYLDYVNLKLVLPPRTLKRNLLKKIELRPKLEKKYEEIISFADPDYSIASLVRIAQLSQNLAVSMMEAPVPAGLTPEQQDIYIEELQKMALPLEEKAINFLRKAIEVSHGKGLYNSWTLKSQDLLRKYEPNMYPEPYQADLMSSQFFYEQGPHLEKLTVPEPEPVAPAPVAPKTNPEGAAAGSNT
jgi:TolA-binding protein